MFFLQTNFPYKNCSEDSILDGQLLQKLKEKYCHFDMVSITDNAHCVSILLVYY